MCRIGVLDDFNTLKSQLFVLLGCIRDSASMVDYKKPGKHCTTTYIDRQYILKIFVAQTKLEVEQSRSHRFLSSRERRHFLYVEKPGTFESALGAYVTILTAMVPGFFLFLLFGNKFRK